MKNLRFFGEKSASSLFHTWNRLTCCKKAEKSKDRKYENFCDRRTDRLTDRQTGLDTQDPCAGQKRKKAMETARK